MSVRIRGLHVEIANFVDLVHFKWQIAKMKLAILAFLCCVEFVKTSNRSTTKRE